jgi:membrane dipeptidase
MKRLLIVWLMGVAVAACAEPAPEEATGSGQDIVALAREIHEATLTIDSHDDIPFNFATEGVDPGVRGDRQVDIPKMIEGGLDAAFFIVYVGQGERDAAGNAFAKERAMTKFDAIHRMTDEMYSDQIELAYTSEDVGRIAASGKRVAAIGIENGWVIGQDLGLIEEYHRLGARYITLAHNGHNDISDSASPDPELGDAESEHGGISAFGELVITEMNRVGIMVDVSHISRQAMLEATRLSQAPVIASHSSVKALCDVPRNMDDEQLLALRDNGGVIQTVALADFVKIDPERNAAIDALSDDLDLPPGPMTPQRMERMSEVERTDYVQKRTAFDEQMQVIDEAFPPANVSDFVDHIDYAFNLIGIDHVGISSDFDGGGGVEGWNDASETFNVTLELVRRGYSLEEIAKLWGGNLLRVWQETERVAALSQ